MRLAGLWFLLGAVVAWSDEVAPENDWNGPGQTDIKLGSATIEGSLTLPNGVMVQGKVAVRRNPARLERIVDGVPHWRDKTITQQVDSAGRFRFERLDPGLYDVSVSTGAGVVEAVAVTVTENERATIDLVVVPLGRLDGLVNGLGDTESVHISVRRPSEGILWGHVHSPAWHSGRAWEHVRINAARFGNGAFELNGVPDGAYVVEADAGDTSLQREVRVVGGRGSVRFDFGAGTAGLTGRVLAGERALSGMRLELIPDDVEMPFGEASTDGEGHYTVNALGYGDYQVFVKLGNRGTWRSFDVTLTGETVFDVRLGPFSLSGNVGRATAPGHFSFRNHLMQARLLDPGDEPIVYRDFVNSQQMYAFDGLENGNYAVSHASPYYKGVREVTVLGQSLEDMDIEPTLSETRPVQLADAVSGKELQSAECEALDGVWAGTFVVLGRGRQLPLTLADTDMTCSSPGYHPARFRWDGKALELDLEPGAVWVAPVRADDSAEVMHDWFIP